MLFWCVGLGSCLQGYFCQGGAMEPAPQSSDRFPKNGPCPVGHYCPAGCLSPIPCPVGSIRNATGTAFVCPSPWSGIFCSITVWCARHIISVNFTCTCSPSSSCFRWSVRCRLLRLSSRSVLLHSGSGQPQWPLCCWFLLPLWLLFNHSTCLPLSQGKSRWYTLSFFSLCHWIPLTVPPFSIVPIVFPTLSLLLKLMPSCS